MNLILCLHLTLFSWHTIFALPCCAGTVPVPIYIFCSGSVPRKDYCDVWNSYCSFGMEAYNFIARIAMESIVLISLFSVLCLGSHHAITRRGRQLRRLYVLWRRLARQKLANALACAAALPKLLFMLYREPRHVWSFERQVTVNSMCAYMYR